MFSDAATLYVSLGWKVFPLKKGSKLPAIKGGHGFKDATDDLDQLDRWASEFPNCNIAVATGEPSGIVVVDVDPRNGGKDSMARLAGDGFIFPPCIQAKTGNGGWHLYFRLPPGLKASKDRLGKGIDIKAAGGYVVAPLSQIAKSDQGPGGAYEWVRSPEKLPLGPFPAWALDRLRPKPSAFAPLRPMATHSDASRSLEGMARRLAQAGEGHRNNILNWAAYTAGILVREGKLGAAEVDSRLTQAALSAGLVLPEVKATIQSGLTGAHKNG